MPAGQPAGIACTAVPAHPWLRAARCVTRPGRPVAVAVPSEEGYRQLRRHGHAHVAACCHPAAAADVRLVDEQLAGALETTDAGGCLALFAAPWPDLPVVLDQDVAAAAARFELRVPPDLCALRGHFASLPIVPGVVQVAWALHFARAALGATAALSAMDHVKFRRIVQPGHRLTLSITPDARPGSLSFRLGMGDELFSGGRLFLEGGGA